MKHYTFVDYATQGYTALVGLLILFFHNATVPHWPWLLAVHAVNLVLVHALVQTCGSGRPGKVLGFLRHFYPLFLYTWFYAETGRLNHMFVGDYMDPMAIRWEQALFGCQPSVLFMQKLPFLPLSELLYAAYFSYYLMIAAIGLALFLRDRRQFFHFVSVVSFVFYICYLTYIFLPIVGPPLFFSEIPGYALPAKVQHLVSASACPDAIKAGIFFRLMAWIYRVFETPGAAFPSSHVAIAMTTVCFSFRYLRCIRWPHLVIVILLCLATVYCRYHYVVDVLAGLATAALLVPLGNWLYARFPTTASDSRCQPSNISRQTKAGS